MAVAPSRVSCWLLVLGLAAAVVNGRFPQVRQNKIKSLPSLLHPIQIGGARSASPWPAHGCGCDPLRRHLATSRCSPVHAPYEIVERSLRPPCDRLVFWELHDHEIGESHRCHVHGTSADSDAEGSSFPVSIATTASCDAPAESLDFSLLLGKEEMAAGTARHHGRDDEYPATFSDSTPWGPSAQGAPHAGRRGPALGPILCVVGPTTATCSTCWRMRCPSLLY